MSDVAPSETTTHEFVDLHARAARLGAFAWIERRTFEVFGSWAGSTEVPAVAAHFGAMSRRHGWHAEVMFDRLPELASVDADQLVAAPGSATEALLGALTVGTSMVGRLVGAYRVLLPALVSSYRAELATVSAVAEPSLGRWLEIVLRDDLDEWCRGVALLGEVLLDEGAVRAAAARQLELDLLLAPTEHLRR